jgi:hypothetical protein
VRASTNVGQRLGFHIYNWFSEAFRRMSAGVYRGTSVASRAIAVPFHLDNEGAVPQIRAHSPRVSRSQCIQPSEPVCEVLPGGAAYDSLVTVTAERGVTNRAPLAESRPGFAVDVR